MPVLPILVEIIQCISGQNLNHQRKSVGGPAWTERCYGSSRNVCTQRRILDLDASSNDAAVGIHLQRDSQLHPAPTVACKGGVAVESLDLYFDIPALNAVVYDNAADGVDNNDDNVVVGVGACSDLVDDVFGAPVCTAAEAVHAAAAHEKCVAVAAVDVAATVAVAGDTPPV